MLSHGRFRTHVINITIQDTSMRLWFYDRVGIIKSAAFSVTDLALFGRVISVMGPLPLASGASMILSLMTLLRSSGLRPLGSVIQNLKWISLRLPCSTTSLRHCKPLLLPNLSLEVSLNSTMG
ncbi:hypothetical protein BS47DRAFT_461334 [Hydnum rufescens UP504]|uniref:Uncharacterized protein n=1 Tax=Hydnum rufescens UP504 TaxID=1448309 RepID=A0A9P6AHS1_9AGAM|nr:hypothetical protein BS47DRAFT_461334 [Hydnum rufescens UP504]